MMNRFAVAVVMFALVAARTPGRTQAAESGPSIFAPGIISGPSNDGSPTFSSDGKTLYFTRSDGVAGAILESHFVDGTWTKPDIAAFSGTWNDQHPALAPDGSFLVFVSTRPPVPGAPKGARLWRVDRTEAGWSAARVLPPAVNIGIDLFAPSVAADGSIYFLDIDHGVFTLYHSACIKGVYQKARPLSFSTVKTRDVDPEIAPDQSSMLFASSGRSDPKDTKEHLYVITMTNGTWGDARRIHYRGEDLYGGSNDNEPRLAPDGHTLYFASDRSMELHFPRTHTQAEADLARSDAWDNGNTNVWTLPYP